MAGCRNTKPDCDYSGEAPTGRRARRRFPRGPRGDHPESGKTSSTSTRARPQRILGPAATLERRGAATAAADACARDAEREFHRGCLGTCGKTCDELGHDPVLFEKLKDAVKRWPDAGGGEAIPDVCGFDATIAWDADQTWWTWRQVLAILAPRRHLGRRRRLGRAASRSRRAAATRRLQKMRNWAADGTLTRWGLFCAAAAGSSRVTRPVCAAGLEFLSRSFPVSSR